MLGVRRVYKANLTCTPAELAYGTTLHLPGWSYNNYTAEAVQDMQNYVFRLEKIMGLIDWFGVLMVQRLLRP